MLKEKIDTVILDIDGTLTETISWYEITEGLGASRATHVDIFEERFRKGKLSYLDAKKELIGLWRSTRNANKKYMEKMFRSWKFKKDVVEIVEYLKKFYRLCLISGSVDLYVEAIAERLGIPHWYANTDLIWDKEGNLVDLNYYADQAAKKLEQFNEFISRNNIEKERCSVIGDGDSDIALFRELHYGIAVNKDPHPELESLAFKMIKELKEIKKIL
ncbi:hypothetical protein A2V56_03195 [Candidatus Woesebacteria bacterium RBG_19FT_COMBO_42_9]|uniref:phosphoserine phosphatase n=1 Tax=Candidatus Woesebacteria bacterium RBG_16_42_24 TaxID=1802485 RepID=A0A1F7XJZ3_9BACT|nr:MAG: hypothetical protein A2V97_01910 [Candidatus Woesebacteria bacterium RBG_16_42_24]OGM16383.1 MAG: hypothetical protein A2V56_03195 [Candidatus Woesebacteria bacterium RBG_19FT_COMBO_42_9]OGM66395.1 MAG: hypothetical protein A2985_03650 [Candidatus Woesebacteria bacterium RIFCSPLOWO2_01_FULL_43_11]